MFSVSMEIVIKPLLLCICTINDIIWSYFVKWNSTCTCNFIYQ